MSLDSSVVGPNCAPSARSRGHPPPKQVCANLENGVLRVTIPKKEMPTQERKEIPVQSGAAGSS